MKQREKDYRRAIDILGADTAKEILETIATTPDITACELIGKDLKEGKTLDDIFLTGEQYGFELEAKRLEKRDYIVSFGCLASGDAGDGGTWRVKFDEAREIKSAVESERWIA